MRELKAKCDLDWRTQEVSNTDKSQSNSSGEEGV